MTILAQDHEYTVRAEWCDGGCTVTVEAWEVFRARERAARMPGVTWGPCRRTMRGTWIMAGVAQNPR